MALVWIALLIEFAVAFTVAAALAYWAQHHLTVARPRAAAARSSSRVDRAGRRRPADLRATGNHRAPCADH